MSPGMEVSSPGLSFCSSYLSRWVQHCLWAQNGDPGTLVPCITLLKAPSGWDRHLHVRQDTALLSQSRVPLPHGSAQAAALSGCRPGRSQVELAWPSLCSPLGLQAHQDPSRYFSPKMQVLLLKADYPLSHCIVLPASLPWLPAKQDPTGSPP